MSRSYGTVGEHHTAIVNAFEVKWSSRGTVYHYNELIPEWENKSGKPVVLKAAKGSEVMMRLQTQIHPGDFPNPGAFDGKKNLFSFTKFKFPMKEYSGIPLDRSDSNGRRPKTVKIKIAFVNDVNIGILNKLTQSKVRPDELGVDGVYYMALNMLNLFVQAQPRRANLHKGKSFYIDRNSSHATDRAMSPLKLLNGYFQSIRPALNRLILNVDVTVGAVLQRQSLVDACAGVCGIGDRARLRDVRSDSPNFMKLRQFFRGVKIIATTDSRRREKTIKDIIFDVGREKFDKDGQWTTVQDHFLRMHNITIPPRTLGVRLGNHEMLPITVCDVVNQLYKGRLQPNHVSEVLKFIPQRPQYRLEKIKAGWQTLGHNTSEFLHGADITISQDAMTVSGRVLPSPQIMYGKQSVSVPRQPGVWDVMHKTLQQPAKVNCLLTFNLTGDRTTVVMMDFIKDLKAVMYERGMEIRRDAGFDAYNPQAEIGKILDRRKNEVNATLIIAILPENAQDLYNDVKRFGDIESGVVTQCVRWSPKVWRTDARRMNQYHNNLILKINAKLGGINYTPKTRMMNVVSEMPTMIIGADVSHPSPGSSTPSIASLVASFDPQASRYAAFLRPQHSRLEIINDIQALMHQALNAFTGPKFSRNPPPRRVIIFRDGVSEGEFEKVREYELGGLKEFLTQAYQKINAPHRPRITFIIVGKRHHYRFFPENERNADRTGNCPPGLVVDRDIAHPVYMDFYLQSQAGLKGTSVPSHYTVLEDENFGGRADDLQELAYSLCHNYARATRSVKIPAPVYYADLVCRRAKFHYDNEVHYSDNMSVSSGEENHLDWFKQHFKDVKKEMLDGMFFL